MKNIISIILLSTIPPSLFSAEPSAFGAGNLDNPEPYGLTSNEKVILQNKKELKTVVVKSNNQKNEVNSLRERIDGLQGIIESLSRKSHNNKITLSKIKEETLKSDAHTDEYEKRLSEVIQNNTLKIEETDKKIEELSLALAVLKKDYVTKEEFNILVNDVNVFKSLVAKELKKRKPSESGSNSAELYKQANAYYAKRYYTKAIESFETLIKRNYRPAFSHYMIGEMNFKRKNYANAITYFKKSSSLYSKASYMPRLMLHSAIAMEKTGDMSHANAFYNAIIAKYPNSKEAVVARKK